MLTPPLMLDFLNEHENYEILILDMILSDTSKIQVCDSEIIRNNTNANRF